MSNTNHSKMTKPVLDESTDDLQSQIAAALAEDVKTINQKTMDSHKINGEEEDDEHQINAPLLNHNNLTHHHHSSDSTASTNGTRSRPSTHRSPLDALHHLSIVTTPHFNVSSLIHQMKSRIIPIIAISLICTIIYLSSIYLSIPIHKTPISILVPDSNAKPLQLNENYISKGEYNHSIIGAAGLLVLSSCMNNSASHRLALFFSSSSTVTSGMIAIAALESDWCVAVITEEDDAGHLDNLQHFHQTLEAQYEQFTKSVSTSVTLDQIQRKIGYIDLFVQSTLPYKATSSQNFAYLMAIDLNAEVILELSPTYTYNSAISYTKLQDIPIDTAVNLYPVIGTNQNVNSSIVYPHEFYTDQAKWTPPTANNLPTTSCVPIIQHMLVSGVSNENSIDPLTYPSLAIDSSAYSPFITLSTVYLSPSFFSLYIPVSLSTSFNQITRSYVTQTLLSYLHTPTHPYILSNLVTDLVSNEVKQNWYMRDSITSNRGSLQSSHAEPCILITPPYLTDNVSSILSSASLQTTLSLEEQTLLDNLVVLLSERRKGGKFDLQIRLQTKNLNDNIDSTTPIPVIDILLLLYNDLADNNILPGSELDSLKLYLNHYSRLHLLKATVKIESPRIESPLVRYLPFRQSVFGLCVNFNFPPNYNSLLQILRYHTRLNKHVAVVFPTKESSLDIYIVNLLNKFPYVTVIECEESNKGFYMTWCIMHCLEHYNQIIQNDKNNNKSISLQGVMWTADDMYFNYTVVFPTPSQLPDPHLRTVPMYLTSNDLQTTHLTFPFDEFWFSPTDDMEDLESPLDAECKCYGRDNQFRDDRWVWLTPQKEYLKNLKQLYKLWPDQWKECIGSIRGGKEYQGIVLTNAVADLIYIPNHYNALTTLLNTLKTLYPYKDNYPVFGEILVPVLIDISMCLIHRPTVSPSLIVDNLGVFWSDTLAGHVSESATPRKPNKDTTLFYSRLINFMNEYKDLLMKNHSNGNILYNETLSFRPRPVPFRKDGYRWDDRKDWELFQWMIDQGEPPFIHSFKLSDENNPGTKMWREAQEKMLVKLIEDRLL